MELQTACKCVIPFCRDPVFLVIPPTADDGFPKGYYSGVPQRSGSSSVSRFVIVFQRENVVAIPVNDLLGNLFLASHRIHRNDGLSKVDQLQ